MIYKLKEIEVQLEEWKTNYSLNDYNAILLYS